MKIVPSVIAVVCVALALTAFCPISQAQDDAGRREGGRRGGGGQGGGRAGVGVGGSTGGDSISGLLRTKEVREELKITDTQDAAIKKLAESNRPKRPEGVNFREMSEEDRTAFFAKMQKEQAASAAEMQEQLEEVLLPKQMKRAKEIALQVQGVRALGQAEVAEKLGITKEQTQELKDVQASLQDGMREKMRELFSGGNREGMQEKMTEIRNEMEEKVLAVLTADQKSKFDEMKGDPFEMPQSLGRGGGRGGRGGDAGGGRGGRGGDAGGGRGGQRGGGGRGQGGRGRPESE